MSGLDSLYRLPLDFIDRDKFLDLLEKVYEAGFKDAGGEVPAEVFHAENRTKGPNDPISNGTARLNYEAH